MTAIFKKELWQFIGNRSIWFVMAASTVIGGLFLFWFENDFNIFDIGTASLQSYFVLIPWILLFLIPAVAMRSIAEEEQSGTLSWLFSQPLSVLDIVAGKFLAVWFVALLCVAPSFVYLIAVYQLGLPEGNLDSGATLGSYLGVVVLTGALSAIGLLASALAKNQITAYLLGVVISFFMYFGIEQLASYRLLGTADYYLGALGFYKHFLPFTRGLVDSRDVAYFIFIIILSLGAAAFAVSRKK
ncbi:ABC transporter permease [Chryseobacterium salipaludis]|uniref:ABC transporter permease n=1 Tax=Chryseobacterium TaxID=59732 RepID=UPI001FF1EF3B|nr:MULTISPECIES: ABC transporter permease [Chryseobacterium]MCJ8496762.1 ABC transporter permease [Chryseobacterium salipaludis]MCX3296243.1 ABC transporter permease [Planobacterium sp. JC490]